MTDIERATEQMDEYIDMGCFWEPDTARPYLIDGYMIGYRDGSRDIGMLLDYLCGDKGYFILRGQKVTRESLENFTGRGMIDGI